MTSDSEDRRLADVWDSYQPLEIMSQYPEYPLSIFNTFHLNMIKRESQLQTLERFPKYQRWLWLQTGKTLYSIARRFKNIYTNAAFREIFIIGVCDIHIDDHDQLRYSNDEKTHEGTPSRQKLWTQGMENQEVSSEYFWRKYSQNTS